MVTYSSIAIFVFAALTSAGKAPMARNAPPDTIYAAVFEDEILGSVLFWPTNNYTTVGVGLENLPKTGGPYMYQVNDMPVGENGDCPVLMGQLDPFNGTMDARMSSQYKVGDLSGKHGMINGTSVADAYIDSYLSLNPKDPSYIGGKSVVVHYANYSTLACANITEETVLHPRKGSARLVARFGNMNPSSGESGGSTGESTGGLTGGLVGELTGGLMSGLASLLGL